MFKHISVNKNICGGKPCLKGTRIPVYMVTELIEHGVDFEQIQKDYYPHLTVEQMQECYRYANVQIKEKGI
ncbi:DUF433 domain-containing protein [candidate division KSB1 bacterium]|nr:DUF433 domain-containing protein [candidate division KSB1 bacterium]MBL7094736.1 DUF433 domain-containing protein [candidate division KSB1 bacterium]